MDGKGHARIAVAIGVTLSLGGLYLMGAGYPEAGLGSVLGAVSGWLITPDADHNTRTEEEKRLERIPVLGKYFLSVWAGYGAKYKHRGRSHWPIWGTCTRVWYFGRRFLADYLFLIWFAIVGLNGGTLTLDGSVVKTFFTFAPLAFYLAWFAAWSIQDFVHILTDWVWSGSRKVTGRFRGKKKDLTFRKGRKSLVYVSSLGGDTKWKR